MDRDFTCVFCSKTMHKQWKEEHLNWCRDRYYDCRCCVEGCMGETHGEYPNYCAACLNDNWWLRHKLWATYCLIKRKSDRGEDPDEVQKHF